MKKNIGVRIFLLALFLSYFSDITFFTHSHIIQGMTIVHSHFSFGSSSKPDQPVSHSHSNQALALLAQASTWTAVVQPTPVIPSATITKIIIWFSEIQQTDLQTSFQAIKQRGPPAVSIAKL